MREITRRQMCVGLSAVAATGGVVKAQSTAASPVAAATLSQAKAISPDAMPARKMANGGESRDVLRGTLTTGEVIAVHESEQPAGTTPNPLHIIQHSEVVVVIQGTVLFEHGGKSDTLGPGGVAFVVPGVPHTMRNVGDGPARYCVVQIGGDTKK